MQLPSLLNLRTRHAVAIRNPPYTKEVKVKLKLSLYFIN
jgi:hypothetical protein